MVIETVDGFSLVRGFHDVKYTGSVYYEEVAHCSSLVIIFLFTLLLQIAKGWVTTPVLNYLE